jgi:hypothetical protein
MKGTGNAQFSGTLGTQLIKPMNILIPKYRIFNIWPFGRLAVAFDRHGEALRWPGGLEWRTNLSAALFRQGKYEGTMDLGSGLVTNVGATAMSNEAVTLASPSAARIHVLFLANQHISGTGVTAASALDHKIQTISTQGGQTAVAGTQTWATTSTMAVPKYQTVATIAYTGSEAVTEWALLTSATVSATTGTPFTSSSATTFTATGTPYTASSTTVQGLQQNLVIPGTTTVIGLIASNTTSVGTLVNNGTTGWWTQAAMTAGSTPGTTEAFTLRPIIWDHKVFSAINVASGDSIQFTYQLTVSSGG